MKQLTCEMCGSTELIKQEGFFVCQTCGTKYSVEEAKKMMIEGTVEVQGTVKVDNSSFVEKYLQNARRSKQKEDWEEMEKYYNLVEQNDPTNIEAIFYSAYGKAKICLLDADNKYKREQIFHVLCNCVSIIDDNFNMEKADKEKGIVELISKDIIRMAGSNFVYKTVDNSRTETIRLFNKLQNEFCATLNNISTKYLLENRDDRVWTYRLLVEQYEFLIKNGELNRANEDEVKNMLRKVHEKWHEADEAHLVPVEEKPEISGQPQNLRSLEIISIIFAFLWPPVGWVLCVITLLKAKKENNKRKMKNAIWTMVCSIIFLIILIVSLS